MCCLSSSGKAPGAVTYVFDVLASRVDLSRAMPLWGVTKTQKIIRINREVKNICQIMVKSYLRVEPELKPLESAAGEPGTVPRKQADQAAACTCGPGLEQRVSMGVIQHERVE